LITVGNVIVCFQADFIYETRFSSFSPFPVSVNGLMTFYRCSDELLTKGTYC